MKVRLAKTLYLIIILLAVIAFSACGTANDAASRVFRSIDNADLPDMLEKTVGTLGDIYYTSFHPSHGEDWCRAKQHLTSHAHRVMLNYSNLV